MGKKSRAERYVTVGKYKQDPYYPSQLPPNNERFIANRFDSDKFKNIKSDLSLIKAEANGMPREQTKEELVSQNKVKNLLNEEFNKKGNDS